MLCIKMIGYVILDKANIIWRDTHETLFKNVFEIFIQKFKPR